MGFRYLHTKGSSADMMGTQTKPKITTLDASPPLSPPFLFQPQIESIFEIGRGSDEISQAKGLIVLEIRS